VKNVTITLSEDLARRSRIEAAREGKSLSKYIAETLERRIGPAITKQEAMERFLSGPSLDLLDENGKAPPRSSFYE
jgi:hypothetical protein